METVQAARAAFKKCTACGETKAVSDFCKHRGHADGLNSHCRACKSAKARGKYATDPATRAKAKAARDAYNATHAEWKRDYDRKYYEANRERLKSRFREVHRTHRDERLAYAAARYAEHRDEYRARAKAWVAKNRGAARACGHRRYRREIAQRITIIGARHIRERLTVFGGRCVYCGGPGNASDHRIALAAGGLHILANIVAACIVCNSKKRTKRAVPAFLHAGRLPLPG